MLKDSNSFFRKAKSEVGHVGGKFFKKISKSKTPSLILSNDENIIHQHKTASQNIFLTEANSDIDSWWEQGAGQGKERGSNDEFDFFSENHKSSELRPTTKAHAPLSSLSKKSSKLLSHSSTQEEIQNFDFEEDSSQAHILDYVDSSDDGLVGAEQQDSYSKHQEKEKKEKDIDSLLEGGHQSFLKKCLTWILQTARSLIKNYWDKREWRNTHLGFNERFKLFSVDAFYSLLRLGLVFSLYQIFYSEGGVRDWQTRKNKIHELENEKKSLQAQNHSLTEEIKRLKTDKKYQRKIVREELGVVAPDEYVLIFPKETSSPAR